MERNLSEILKNNIVIFVYRDGFEEVGPGMLSLLGYSENVIKNMSLNSIIADYDKTLISKVLKDDEIMSSDGSLSDTVIFKDSLGGNVRGILNIRWRGGEDKCIFGFFFPSEEIGLDGKSIAGERISDMSLSAYVEIDEDYVIVAADKGFRFCFDLEEDPVGKNIKDIKGLEVFCSLLKNNKSDCFEVPYGNDKLVAIVKRTEFQTDIRLYGRDFLLYSRFPSSFPGVQARRLIWDGAPMAMLLDPEKNVIVEANKSASLFYGYSIEEFRGMPISNINVIPPDIQRQELEMAALGTKRLFISRHRIADGAIKDISETATLIEFFGKKYVFVFLTDITRKKNLEKIIERKNRSLSELNRQLSKMLKNKNEDL